MKATPPSELLTNVLIAVMCAIWGTTWLVVKMGVVDLPPFSSAAMRMGIAAVVMAVVAALLLKSDSGEKPPIWLSIVMGIGNFAVTYGIVYWASQILPSGVIALLWAVFPMMMAITGHFFLDGEKLRPIQWIGFVLGFAGVAVLTTDLSQSGDRATLAALIVLISPLAACVSTAIVKKHGANVNSNLLNRDGLFVSTVILGAMALLFERDAEPVLSNFAIFSVGYLAIMGTVVTFGIYYYLLRYAPAYKLSLIAFITPAIAMGMGTIFGDESATTQIFLGALLILGGVILVVARRRAA